MDDVRETAIAELLTHAEWVRRLCRGLLADAALAEDVEQEVWLRALVSPPRHGSGLPGWLRRVAERARLQRLRSAGRRARRETRFVVEGAVGSTGSVPSAAEVAERAELLRRVVGVVLQLPEPGRGTVLGHYLEGRSLAELAARDGVPASTVRNRLRRALAAVRQRLDAESPGGEAAWTVLAISPPAVRTWVVGGFLVSAKWSLWVAAAAVVVLVAAGSLRDRVVSGPLVGSGGDGGGVGSVAEEAAGVAGGLAIDAVRSRTDAAAEAGDAAEGVAAAVRGQVTDVDGVGLAGAQVRILRREPTGFAMAAELRTDDSGGFAWDGALTGGSFCVEARAERHVPERAAVTDAPVVVRLKPAVRLTGRVIHAEDGRAWSGVRLSYRLTEGEDWERAQAVSDGQGRFALGWMPRGERCEIAIDRNGYLPESHLVQASQEDVELLLPLGEGFAWSAEVVDCTSGAPLSGVRVEHYSRSVGVTDANGRVGYRFSADATELDFFKAGYTQARVDVDARAHEPGVIPMYRSGRLYGLIRDAGGAGVAASLRLDADEVRSPSIAGAVIKAPPDVRYGVIGEWSATAAEDGSYEMTDIPSAMPLSMVATAAGYLPTRLAVGVVPPGESQRVVVTLERGGSIAGVVTLRGQPVAALVRYVGQSEAGVARSADDGHYHIDAAEPGRGVLVVRSPDRRVPDASVEVECVAGELVRRDIELQPVAVREVSGWVVNGRGTPIAGIAVVLAGPQRERLWSDTDAAGWFAFEVPDAWTTVAVLASRGPVTAHRSGVPVGTTDLNLVLADVGRVALRVINANGVVVPGCVVHWRPAGGAGFQQIGSAMTPTAAGLLEFDVPAGPLELVVDTEDARYAAARVAADVPADGTVERSVTLLSGVELRLHWSGDIASLSPQTFAVAVVGDDQAGLSMEPNAQTGTPELQFNRNLSIDESPASTRPFNSRQFVAPADGQTSQVPGLAAGHYVLRAWPDRIRFEPDEFVVDGPGPVDVRVHFAGVDDGR